MKIITISDTHSQHLGLKLPEGDMIIHAGDVSGSGSAVDVKSFLNWFSNLDYKYKIFIAGNHDWFFEKNKESEIEKHIPENVIYLNDSGVTIENINIWGSPVQPWFLNWAFNRMGKEIIPHWNKIPENTDILITHGPPYNILDKTTQGTLTGCPYLLEKINETKPKYHIFGHIHEAYGIIEKNNTTFINASVLDVQYRRVNDPIIFEMS